MKTILIQWYRLLILKYSVVTLLITLLLTALSGIFIKDFELDASGDSLVLENDKDLQYYRAIRARYGSDDYLFITYRPREDLFSAQTLQTLAKLTAELETIERVASVVNILNVPLIDSPRIGLSEIQKHTPSLSDPDVDPQLAKKEFLSSPLYKDLLLSADAKTTAIQVNFRRDTTYQNLLTERNKLRVKQLNQKLSPAEQQQLQQVSAQFTAYATQLQEQEQKDITRVRRILSNYMPYADIHLGGVPMIVADMIEYIDHDIKIFGLGVLCLLVLLLTISFGKPRWVFLPMLVCVLASVGMVGFLGMMDWRVTVVSSNFISLMLILTLSLMVHLIVRYQELHSTNPALDHRQLVWLTISSKAQPAFYTALTTMVAFGSLLVSGIRPVIDFGWMMFFGVGLAFVLSFILFPTGLLLLKKGKPRQQRDFTGAVTRSFAGYISRFGNSTILLYVAVFAAALYGISQLSVENRFIDYFKKDTEIYQGMLTIDQELGGTTPLDVILEPDRDYYEFVAESKQDALEDDFESTGTQEEQQAGISGTSYWFNIFQLETVSEIHQYLEQLPQTGKVLSMATTMELLTQLNGDDKLDNMSLAVMYKRLPENIKTTLFDPYMSSDGNQVRFSIRVYESDTQLKRQELLDRIRHDLQNKLGLEPEQIHLSGMVVLYNNMLQSLFKSQILTIGVVFLAILLMFIVLFRSVRVSLLAIIPNVFAALFVLGLMGLLGIRLDIMTITIAAITIGIGVDDTIHYVHRFMEEFPKDNDYWATVKRCHASIGKAMYYTSVTITLGFSILALSNFWPSIYFGLLTGVAMVVALLANLTLLPLLLVKFRPLTSA